MRRVFRHLSIPTVVVLFAMQAVAPARADSKSQKLLTNRPLHEHLHTSQTSRPRPQQPAHSVGPFLHESISGFLAQYPEISIAFTEAPGNGHQASTKLVMDRLREYGYQGKFKIFVSPEVKNQVTKFLPGYNPKSDKPQVLPNLNATVSPLKEQRGGVWLAKDINQLFDSGKINPISRLAIVGGEDTSISPASLDADAVLVVQPSKWYYSPEVRILAKDGSNDFYRVVLTEQTDYSLRDVIPNPENTAEFIKSEMSFSKESLKKVRGLQAIAKSFDEHEILTAYGLSYERGPKKLASILKSASELQVSNPGFKKGIVVPLLSNFNQEEWAEFNQLLGKHFGEKIKVTSIDSDGLAGALKSLAQDDVLVVKTGPVSQPVWNYLMSKSTYPATVAGTTSTHFMKQLGKPFISTVNSRYPDEVSILTESLYKPMITDDRTPITEFMRNARDPESLFNKTLQSFSLEMNQGPEKVDSLLRHLGSQRCFIPALKTIAGSTPAAGKRSFFKRLSSFLNALRPRSLVYE